MTFEEFFHKKKIDLVQLEQAEAALFFEFKSHFEVMGAKSFDHSKKFWFNKLRRLYHIVEVPKVEKTKIEINQIASQAEPLSSPVSEIKTGFTPRFKAKSAISDGNTASEEKQSTNESEIAVNTKPAFQPRFRPQLNKPEVKIEANVEDSELEKSQLESHEEAVPKPVFKPRFKPPLAKPNLDIEPINIIEDRNQESLEEVKPIGFKPRFKAQITKQSTEAPEILETKPVEIKEELKTDGEAPKLGFKPRFKAGVNASKADVSENKELVQSEEKIVEEPAPKLGFKSRFKAGITKPAIDELKSLAIQEGTIEVIPTEVAPNLGSELQPENTPEIKSKTDTVSQSSNSVDKEKLADTPPAKPGFKPRFKAQVTKQNPPEEPE